MPNVSLRRLLSKLTAIALSASTAAASASPRDEACDLDADRPLDVENMDPREAASELGRKLAMAFTGMRPLEATQLAASWSLADDPVRRIALATALEWSFPLVGDALVIDHLSRDLDPAIRAAAARAAWVRRPTGGDLGVLERLTRDPDPTVRAVATAA